jgi:hypothetical protein
LDVAAPGDGRTPHRARQKLRCAASAATAKKDVHSGYGQVTLVEMQSAIDTRQPRLVEAEVKTAYRAMFADADKDYVRTIFQWATDCFQGKYLDYQPIDAHYHDMEHTMQGALCMSQLLWNRHDTNTEPRLTRSLYELGMLAILMHDTGYLKRRGDAEGTGAKYTLTHVDRSIQFAGELMVSHEYAIEEILAVQNMIRCTGVNVKLDTIRFQDDLERIVGFSLGTADLLGQMAASDYVEKLPILYSEFAEAASYNEGKMKAGGFFSSAEDLMQKTPMFWEKYVKQKIDREFLGVYRFLNEPYPDGANFYIERIEANIAQLRQQLSGRGKAA